MNKRSWFKRITTLPFHWIMIGISLTGVVAGLAILASRERTVVVLTRAIVHYESDPAVILLLVAVGSLIAALLAAWHKVWRSSAIWRVLVVAIAIVGLFSSLNFRDDYTGGSCGDFDWPAGHLHAGYPYSWLDGQICTPPRTDLGEYAREHPEEALWYPDLSALVVDALFWGQIGILVSASAGMVTELTERTRFIITKRKTVRGTDIGG